VEDEGDEEAEDVALDAVRSMLPAFSISASRHACEQ